MRHAFIIATLALTALFLLSACEMQGKCVTNTDCKGGNFCINGMCTSFSLYKDTGVTPNAAPPQEQKKDPVMEIFEICNNDKPAFDARTECARIRTTKYSDRSICDYTVGPPIRYNMGLCYNCIVSCK